MELIIKCKPLTTNPFDGSKWPDEAEEREALSKVATEIQQLNTAMGVSLINGPIACNPAAAAYEGYLGDCNGRLNSYGYVRAVISNYASLDWPELVPTTFSLALGEPVRGDENGGEGVAVGTMQ